MSNLSVRRWPLSFFLGLVGVFALLVLPARGQEKKPPFALEKGDRIAWIGSSSTNIGVWPQTMEFLLRTRHPELQLSFKKFSTGGGTFATGLKNLDKWLDEFHPTVVVFNYGSNDAGAGEKGLPGLKENMTQCVAKVEASKARVLFSTFQAADVRKSGAAPAGRRKLYAETLLSICKEKNWPVVDVFQPLDMLQQKAQKDDDAYTMLRDSIHLTNPAYIAWGYFLYDGLRLGDRESSVSLNADGTLMSVSNCQVTLLSAKDGEIRFVRHDKVLPILPPGPLPPRKYVPLEKCSMYRLQIAGLNKGAYEIQCEGKTLGTISAAALAQGVNLNSVLLDSGTAAPWEPLTKQIWAGQALDQIAKTAWSFRIVRKE